MKPSELRGVRAWLVVFTVALVVSGLTAMFVREELRVLSPLFADGSLLDRMWPSMAGWLSHVQEGVEQTYDDYGFLVYGYDWLAFGHLVAAIPFVMAVRDPRRFSWVVTYGLIACIAVVPFALVMGPLRGIPLYWAGIDTLFGIVGTAILLVVRRSLRRADRRIVPSEEGTSRFAPKEPQGDRIIK